MPDLPVLERLKGRTESDLYIPLEFPASLAKAAEFNWMEAVRERMLRVMPETSLWAAKKYLRDASFALFMHRGLHGMGKSASKDLEGCFQLALNRRGSLPELTERKSMLAELKDSPVPAGKEKVELLAMRVKAVFYLMLAEKLNAQKV